MKLLKHLVTFFVLLLFFASLSFSYPSTYTTSEQEWISSGYWEKYDWTYVSELINFRCNDGFVACCQVSGTECAGSCDTRYNCGDHDGGWTNAGHYADCYTSSRGNWCTDSSEPKYWVDTSHWNYYTLCHYVNAITAWGACANHVQWATDWSWGSQRGSTCSNVSFSQYCNRSPTTPTVVVTPNSPPTTPKKSNDLTCTITGFSSDSDGDPITYKYTWLKDGVIQSALTLAGSTASSNTISNANLFYKDTWTCSVFPVDNQNMASTVFSSVPGFMQQSSTGSAGSSSVIIQNTPPTAPIIMPASERIISSGDLNIVVDSVVDPDVLPSQVRSQSLTYFGDVFPSSSLPVYNKFLPVCTSVSCVASFRKTGLDRKFDNCIKLKVFDGDVNSPESDFNCLPVIDGVSIANTTPGGQLAGTSWIKNHFGTAIDPYEQVSCTFTAHDKDNVDLRSNNQLDYVVTLLAQRPGLSSVTVSAKSGVITSGNSVTENFTLDNYPSTTHTYPIGTRLMCKIDISDGFFNDRLVSYSGSWSPKYTWDNNVSTPVGWIEFVNTPPTAPSIQSLDRYNNSTELGVYVGSTSVDPDVFATSQGGQSLTYFARIWDQYNTPTNPAPLCNYSKTKGDFNGPLGVDMYFSVPLVSERLFSTDARAFDANEYSNCSMKVDSNETPFTPTCTSFGFNSLDIVPLVYPTPTGKTTVVFDVNCNKSPKIVDNKWLVSIANAHVEDASGLSVPLSNFIPVVDCNSTNQSSKVVFDSDVVGGYLIDFNYGGVYNGKPLWCTSNPMQVNVTDNGGPIEENDLGLVVKDVVVRGFSDGTLDVNFGVSAALPVEVTGVVLSSSGVGVGAVYLRPSPVFDVPVGSFLNFSSKFGSSEPRVYSLVITYRGKGPVGGDAYSDVVRGGVLFSGVGEDVVYFDGVVSPEKTLTITFVLTSDGTAVFEPAKIAAIPDSNPIIAIILVLSIIVVFLIKRK